MGYQSYQGDKSDFRVIILGPDDYTYTHTDRDRWREREREVFRVIRVILG